MDEKARREAALMGARASWKAAPGHVRLMAGAYVDPLLAALESMGAELNHISAKVSEQGVALAGLKAAQDGCKGASCKPGRESTCAGRGSQPEAPASFNGLASTGWESA